MTYVLNDDNGTINLYGFARETLFILNSLVKDLKPTTRVLPFFSPDPRSQFILYNSDTGDIRIYEHYWANNKDGKLTFYLRTIKELQLNAPKDIESTSLHTAFSTNYAENVMMVDNNHIYYFNVVTKTVKKY